MKNPTAILLWNFLIIIVPPILKQHSKKELQSAMIHCCVFDDELLLLLLLLIIANDSSVMAIVIPNIEYHQPAINFREEPPHKWFAKKVVYCENMVICAVLSGMKFEHTKSSIPPPCYDPDWGVRFTTVCVFVDEVLSISSVVCTSYWLEIEWCLIVYVWK